MSGTEDKDHINISYYATVSYSLLGEFTTIYQLSKIDLFNFVSLAIS